MAIIIDGKQFVDLLVPQLQDLSAKLRAKGVSPRLDIVLVGNNPASELFIEKKQQFAKQVGVVTARVHRFPESASHHAIAALLKSLSADRTIHGVVLQLPLPARIKTADLVRFINPEQDVDGLTYASLGSTVYGESNDFNCPCAAQVAVLFLKSVFNEPLAGKAVLVIGHSPLVGRPVAETLLHQGCTVTVAHKQTTNLPELVAQAEIVISATGVPHLLKPEWLQQKTVVIDIGTYLRDGKLYGDVDYQQAKKIVRAISPVPGGVGPVTVAVLMLNVLRTAWRQLGKNHQVTFSTTDLFKLVVCPKN